MSCVTDPIHAALTELRSERGRIAIADAWAQWAGTEVEVETSVAWTTYRPHRQGRMVLDVTITTDDGEVQDRQIMFVVDPPGTELRPLDPIDLPEDVLPPMRITPWNATGWIVPHVPQPAALADLLRPETLADVIECPVETIGEPELVRLVPMRRSLVRTRLGETTAFVKSYAKHSSFRRSLVGLRAASELPVSVPELLAVAPDRSTFVMSGLPGVELSSMITRGNELAEALHATGRALAAVHTAEWGLAGFRSGAAETDDIADLLVADLDAIEPRLADRIATLADRLTRAFAMLETVAATPVHGKCFGDQILYDRSTGGISIVDWDDAVLGDPHFDVGRLIAHLGFLARELDHAVELSPLLAGYRENQGSICPTRLHWHVVAATLLRGKISLLRPLADEWYARLTRLVDLVEQLLEPDTTTRHDVGALLDAVASTNGVVR